MLGQWTDDTFDECWYSGRLALEMPSKARGNFLANWSSGACSTLLPEEAVVVSCMPPLLLSGVVCISNHGILFDRGKLGAQGQQPLSHNPMLRLFFQQ